jgi:hypothetical protein
VVAAFFEHWSAAHAVSNAAGIGLFAWLIVRRESARVLLIVATLAFAFQCFALACMSGEYRGASGFLYALATFALLGGGVHPVLRAAIAAAGIAHVLQDASGATTSPFLPAGVATAWPIHIAGIAAGAVARLLNDAAIRPQRLPVDPSAIGAHEEGDCSRDVLGRAESSQRRSLREPVDDFLRLPVEE